MSKKLNWLRKQLDQSQHTKITGFIGEEIAIELLRQNGWNAQRRQSYKYGDIHAVNSASGETLNIEVKTAKKSTHGYNFCLKKQDRHGVTDCSHADVVLLLCITPAIGIIPFVLPPLAQKSIRLRNPLTSKKYAPYRQSTNNLELSL